MSSILDKIRYYGIIFIIGAFIGYIYEVCFYYLTLGFINNWGVLYGPWLPIYGVGSVLLSLLTKLKHKPIVMFLCSILITGIVEFLVGYILLNYYNMRLWDYRGLFLNIKGLVCFRSVITFSIGSIFLIYILIPIIDKVYNKYFLVKVMTVMVLIVFVVDIFISMLNRTPYLF